jgi:WD40 repeat protein
VPQDGQEIASTSGPNISLWSLKAEALAGQSESKTSILNPAVGIPSVALSSDGRRVLLLPSLRILDTATLEEKAVLGSQGLDYSCGALSASGSVAAACAGQLIDTWSLTDEKSARKLTTLDGHTDKINSVSFSHDARQLVSAAADSTARVWDVATGNQLHVLKHSSQPGVLHASFSHDNARIVSATSNSVCIWDAQSGQKLLEFDVSEAQFVSFVPDDKHIIASKYQQASIIDAKTGAVKHEYGWGEYWATLKDGCSYALHADGWIYRLANFDEEPRRLAWIPASYRPCISSSKSPIFTASSQGIQVCLPQWPKPVTLLIPLN